MHAASASSVSRIACTCGRIMRPFGADSSIGVTSTTSASAQTRSANSLHPSSFGASAPRRFLSVSMPSPVCALTHRTPSGRDGIRSALLKTTRCGISFSRNSARSSVSKSSIPFVPSTTRTAMSVLFKTRFVRSTRLLPSSCSSSSKPEISCPLRKYSPSVGTSSAPMMFIQVDLPEPDCPTMATNSPF